METIAISEHQTLTRSIKGSDVSAFRTLFEQTHESIFNFLYYKLGNIETAEDLLQEVFARVWEKRHQLKETFSLKSYMFTIAHNLAANWIRHNRVVLNFQIEQNNRNDRYESPYLELEYRELQSILIDAVAELPEHPRMVFMMSRFEGLTYKEIARRLNISIKTVECHMVKALKLLRASLQVTA
jgi:RNA polymerase sigma-70 factor (ECF subfamily)